jgi:hypothetical protein
VAVLLAVVGVQALFERSSVFLFMFMFELELELAPVPVPCRVVFEGAGFAHQSTSVGCPGVLDWLL